MTISDTDIATALAAYVKSHPGEAESLSEPARLLAEGSGHTSRRTFPLHVTAGALLVRRVHREAQILLVRHRAYGLLLQPGGHLEPADSTLMDAALRELTEETGIDLDTVAPLSLAPVYVEFGVVPARPEKDEPAHHHLDFGYAFTTDGDIGRVQESEVYSASWYPIAEAEALVGPRIARATTGGITGPRAVTGQRGGVASGFVVAGASGVQTVPSAGSARLISAASTALSTHGELLVR